MARPQNGCQWHSVLFVGVMFHCLIALTKHHSHIHTSTNTRDAFACLESWAYAKTWSIFMYTHIETILLHSENVIWGWFNWNLLYWRQVSGKTFCRGCHGSLWFCKSVYNVRVYSGKGNIWVDMAEDNLQFYRFWRGWQYYSIFYELLFL